MADPDLQIRGRGGHPDPEIRGDRSQKKFFSALWTSFWSKNMGGRGGGAPGPYPGSTTELINRVFSTDVTMAILVSQNNETAAMLVFQTNPVGVELFL